MLKTFLILVFALTIRIQARRLPQLDKTIPILSPHEEYVGYGKTITVFNVDEAAKDEEDRPQWLNKLINKYLKGRDNAKVKVKIVSDRQKKAIK